MKQLLRNVYRVFKRKAEEVLIRLLSQFPASPASIVYRIKSKYGEAQLVQQLLLRQVTMDAGFTLQQAGYSLLGSDDVDGMLLYLLGRGGFTNRISIDIGAGDCVHGNTANLILFHDFQGHMVDGGDGFETGRQVYRTFSHARPPNFVQAFLTSGNVNEVLRSHHVPVDVDVLSIDIDSVDLFIAERIDVQARVVVVEFNNLWGPDESFSVPNIDGFQRELGEFLYGGASLLAYNQVMSKKGYKLVGVAASGFDAFFVVDVADFQSVPATTVRELYESSPAWRQTHERSLSDAIRRKPWVAI